VSWRKSSTKEERKEHESTKGPRGEAINNSVHMSRRKTDTEKGVGKEEYKMQFVRGTSTNWAFMLVKASLV